MNARNGAASCCVAPTAAGVPLQECLVGHQDTATARDLAGLTVADVMLREPQVLDASATLQQVRSLLGDGHVHLVLLTHGHHLVGTVTRDDLPHSGHPDNDPGNPSPALRWARLAGRTVAASVPASTALSIMVATNLRRLAVTADDGSFLGLLCLKASHSGFCSDRDVQSRARSRCREGRAPAGGHAGGVPTW